MSPRGLVAGVLVVLLAAVSADCSRHTRQQTTVRLLKDQAALPPLSMKDLDGRAMSSADWRGKVTIVNFWATWCPPCRAEIPDLIALQKKYPDELRIVGIVQDEDSPETVKQFVSEWRMNYPSVMVTPELEQAFTGVFALPTSFVLDREGRVVQKHMGQI